MDFDEYDYLEKAMDESDCSTSKAKEAGDGNVKERREREKGIRRRNEEFDDEEERERKRSSKKLRGEDYERGRDKERVRDRYRDREWSSRHRSRERRSRHRSRERSSRHRSREQRSRHRSRKQRSMHRSRERRSRNWNREKEKEREREKKERDREKERRYRDRHREKEREGSGRRVRRSSSRRDRDDGRRLKCREAVKPEADTEREQRTVFASNMPLHVREREMFLNSFRKQERDVKLITDKNPKRSQGVGYIEFSDAMSVPMAIALSGKLLLGEPIMVKLPSEAEKNLVQSKTSTGSSADRKLYVSNVHFNVTESYLKQIFETFGTVEDVYLPINPKTGRHKGFGLIQFAQIEHAKAAQSLNGKPVAGRTIKVSSFTDHIGAQTSGTKSADFDDKSGGPAFNAHARAMLTANLDRTGVASSAVGSLGVPTSNRPTPSQQAIPLPPAISAPALPAQVTSMAPEPIGYPTECLLLKNLFDPATKTEFDEIRDDVEEECRLKHGRLTHITVDKNSAGYAYLRFESVKAAKGAQEAMHERWFARRMISAIFLQPSEYERQTSRLNELS